MYFKAEQINAFILISYKSIQQPQKVILNEIRFFNEKSSLLAYINQQKLYLLKEENHPDSIKEFKKLILKYLSGKPINLFDELNALRIDINLEKHFSSEFSRKIINYVINNVKYGQVTNYSDIGKNIGSKAYRAIGNVLKKNPFPLSIIPCHRVIRKDGDIGGFMGNIDNIWQKSIKKKLLEIERL